MEVRDTGQEALYKEIQDKAVGILKETADDFRKDSSNKNILIIFLIACYFITVIFGVWYYSEKMAGMAAQHEQTLADFMSQYDFAYEVTQTIEPIIDNNSSLTIEDTNKINLDDLKPKDTDSKD